MIGTFGAGMGISTWWYRGSDMDTERALEKQAGRTLTELSVEGNKGFKAYDANACSIYVAKGGDVITWSIQTMNPAMLPDLCTITEQLAQTQPGPCQLISGKLELLVSRDGDPTDRANHGHGISAGGRPTRLSRDSIVNAALTFLDREGWDTLTINALANQLGTKGPSLYNHVQSLDDLRRTVRMRVIGDIIAMLNTVAKGAPATTP